MRLARRAGVDRVEGVPNESGRLEERDGVGLNELVAGVAGLRVDVDAEHLEPRTLVAAGRSAGAAEDVEQPHAWPSEV